MKERTVARVFVDTMPWNRSPANTDWRYSQDLKYLPAFTDGVEIHLQRSQKVAIWRNVRGIVSRVRGNGTERPHLGSLDGKELSRSGCNVVYSHDYFPTNCAPVPVIWHYHLPPPELLRAQGLSCDEIKKRHAAIMPGIIRSNYIHVVAHRDRECLNEIDPYLAEKTFIIPWFLPHVRAATEEDVIEKQNKLGPLNVAFVGRQEYRKGLDVLVEAVRELRTSGIDITLTVISGLRDGKISRKYLQDCVYMGEVDHETALFAIKNAHVLAVPSRVETWGVVYVEAMAAGAVPITANLPYQHEIIDNGRCGYACGPDKARIIGALRELNENSSLRIDMAVSANRRFREYYSPEFVALRYKDMFVKAKLASG